jgi:iron complex outermembrane receptor protein
MVGNPNLKPEINVQTDLNLGYKKGGTGFDAGIYISTLRDYITSEINDDLAPRLPTSPGVRQYINTDKALIAGFEMNWSQRISAGLHHRLSIAHTYGQDQVRDEPLPEIAPMDLRYTLIGEYLQNRLTPKITVRYVSKQDRISSHFGETNTPSFVVLDMGVTCQLTAKLSASAGVQNLFDEAYYEHLNRTVRGQDRAIFAPGRNVYLSFFVDLM